MKSIKQFETEELGCKSSAHHMPHTLSYIMIDQLSFRDS